MAPRFIGKTSLAGLHVLRLDEQPVLAQHATLRDMLRLRLGPAAAALFAEPVVTWPGPDGPGSVSWYADASGDAEPLAALPADRRATAERQLRETIGQFNSLLADVETGSLLRCSLACRG